MDKVNFLSILCVRIGMKMLLKRGDLNDEKLRKI